MDYGRPQRADRLAAEYALGTLRGGARRRFESLLPSHPALKHASQDWELRLQLLAGQVEPVEPPEHVWARIEARLFASQSSPAHSASAPARWWAALGLWRGLTAATALAATVMATALLLPAPAAAPIVVVLQSTPAGLELVKTGFVASISADGKALVLRPLAPITVDARQALELWAVPKAGAPRSLGLIRPGDAPTTVLRTGLLQGTGAFAVSLEPAGGSPTGAPTGPIVSAGEI